MDAAFRRELLRFGPDRPYTPLAPPIARAYCRRLAVGHYENFSVASVFLPRRLLKHFHHVYAFCRWADDLADESGGGRRALDLLRWWRGELLECYGGRTRHPILVALRETITEFDIPARPFLDLLWAFEQDQLVTRYRTRAQLLDYCRRSADPVGRIVLHLAGAATPANLVLSDHICTALQLANFWQDVARDWKIGRVYLPEEDRRRFGYRDIDLRDKRWTPAFADLMRYEVEYARDRMYRGMPLIDAVPAEMRVQIELFARGGLAILRKIERRGYNVWRSRPRLRPWEKAALMAGVLWRNWREGKRP